MLPGLPEGRHWEMDPYFNPTATYPYKGSSLIYWDSGNGTPPNSNLPPEHLGDPHGHPRDEPAAAWQEAHFLLTGWNEDVCQGGDYLTRRHPANGGRASCIEPDRAPGTLPEDEDPEPVASALAFSDTQADNGQYSDEVTFEAALTNAEDGTAIAGAPVTIELRGDDTTRSYETATDDDGIAHVAAALEDAPGDYELVASFAGDESYLPQEASMPFTIERDDSSIEITVRGKGSNMTLEARLWETDSEAPFAGETITFYADGELIGEATTNSDGVATLKVPARYRGHRGGFIAEWAGNTYYLGSIDTTTT
jgi:hypothetical protein